MFFTNIVFSKTLENTDSLSPYLHRQQPRREWSQLNRKYSNCQIRAWPLKLPMRFACVALCKMLMKASRLSKLNKRQRSTGQWNHWNRKYMNYPILAWGLMPRMRFSYADFCKMFMNT